MSLNNPFNPMWGWKVDPDNRQNRSSGPCITRMMTKDEKIKYGITVEGEDNMKITKETVRQMSASGMSTAEIAEHFLPAYPNMKKQLMMAKVAMLLSDKKPGRQKADAGEEEHPEPEETTSIKEIAEQVKKQVTDAARDSAERIELSQAVDEMMEMVPDIINHPAHYTTGKIEVIDYLQEKMSGEMFEGFCIGNALKYLSRYRMKGGLEDLKKAKWYLSRIISAMETA